MGICSCCTSCVAKGILGIVNSVFLTLGILFMIFGALFHWGQKEVYKWVSSVLSQVSSTQIGSDKQLSLQDIQTVLGTWSKYLSYAGVILFVMGILLAGLAIVGYVGMCCEIKVLVIVYTVVVGAFGLACLGIVIGYGAFKSGMFNEGKTQMLKLLREQYSNIGGSNDFANVMDLIQARVPCCGVENYTDFYNVSRWQRNYTLNGNKYTLVAPISCCKISGPTIKPDYDSCISLPNSTNSNYMSGGCYDKLWKVFDSYSTYAMYGLGIAAAVCGCILLLAILVLCDMFD